ncbi:uncharacterized protein HMPREF1120_05026 [Exophiala dermatitidis NIH/UT8656]|uniref:Uncharacterized protein n=1 Tax=Exophiala dermatitidis (strain ATCC 34100 / CBS 525.76 / NIH/UT8656) TaxID=858893 RepID=H6BZA6_EXODN|nr:uncharacterized protein HMPREF1120_05026 [Exophiala dermatitidis NIH/UT8656]EHY56969.1 hypothetical protein HMPREF1120_05026 [Exophiala dermatitidis NIH/UT8656]
MISGLSGEPSESGLRSVSLLLCCGHHINTLPGWDYPLIPFFTLSQLNHLDLLRSAVQLVRLSPSPIYCCHKMPEKKKKMGPMNGWKCCQCHTVNPKLHDYCPNVNCYHRKCDGCAEIHIRQSSKSRNQDRQLRRD